MSRAIVFKLLRECQSLSVEARRELIVELARSIIVAPKSPRGHADHKVPTSAEDHLENIVAAVRSLIPSGGLRTTALMAAEAGELEK